MDAYNAVKHVHVACVTLSIGGLFLRGLWKLSGRQLPVAGWWCWAPHANDSILLVAAIALAVMTAQYPITDAWLSAKVLGLCVYIALGSIALKDGIGTATRLAAWLAALTVFAYIASVALTKSPLGFLVRVLAA